MTKTTMHEYRIDPQSGAGNCTCGQPERHVDHFHKYVKAMGLEDICTCGYPENAAACHMDMVWVNDNEVISRSLLEVMKVMNNHD